MKHSPTCRLSTGTCVLVVVTALASFNPSVSYSSGINQLRQQEKVIDTLLTCRGVDSLRAYFKSLPTSDLDIRVIFFTRLWEMGDKDFAGEGLLQTMPQSEFEFSYFYDLCNKPLTNDSINARLNTIACGYFSLLASALRSHPGYLQGFFRLGYAIDGEILELYSSACALVFERDCVHFLRELSHSHPRVEDKIIGALQLGLASDSCLTRNRDQIPVKYWEVLKPK